MILPITMTFAGAAALLNIWLGMRVSRLRAQFKVSVGDGGNEALLRRMRAQANYIEHAPFVLILTGLLELAGADPRILWGAAIGFILARILHAFGMDRQGASRLRMIGMMGTALIVVGLAGWSLYYAYQRSAPPAEHQVQIGPGRTASATPAPRS